jgi:hypothetical protein
MIYGRCLPKIDILGQVSTGITPLAHRSPRKPESRCAPGVFQVLGGGAGRGFLGAGGVVAIPGTNSSRGFLQGSQGSSTAEVPVASLPPLDACRALPYRAGERVYYA